LTTKLNVSKKPHHSYLNPNILSHELEGIPAKVAQLMTLDWHPCKKTARGALKIGKWHFLLDKPNSTWTAEMRHEDGRRGDKASNQATSLMARYAIYIKYCQAKEAESENRKKAKGA